MEYAFRVTNPETGKSAVIHVEATTYDAASEIADEIAERDFSGWDICDE